MKPMLICKCLGLIISLIPVSAMPDSPLTSTQFNRPYSENSMVVMAGKGILTTGMMEYLAAEENPIDIRMAVINRLGWDNEDSDNDSLFLDYLKKSRGYADKNDLFLRGKGHELLCFAYLEAMDNYFEVEEAVRFAEKARSLCPGSFTFNIIAALIRAQKELQEWNWCEVYSLTDRVRNNRTLIKDMHEEAVDIIFRYMDGYREYCPEKMINDKEGI